MLNLFLFITFLAYVFFIFATNNIIFQLIVLFINIILILVFRIPIKKTFINLLFLMPFILITSLFNLIFGTLNECLLITLKLILVCNITYIFKSSFGTTNILNSIEVLFSPLKLLGISPKDISLIINIALTFIPTLIRDLEQIKYCLKIKGSNKLSINNIKYTFKILLTSIFKKTNYMELSLKSKGFSE